MEDKDQIEKGNTLLSWHFPEFEKPERTMTWYIVLFVGAAILVLWAMIEKIFIRCYYCIVCNNNTATKQKRTC